MTKESKDLKKELTVPEETAPSVSDLMAGQVEPQQADAPSEMAALAVSSFIPSFSIAYGSSKVVEQGIAKMGEFILAGQTALGKECEVVALDFRLHAAHVNKDTFGFEGDAFHLSSDKRDAKDDTEYQNFINGSVPKDCELQSGADLFLYIPSVTAFGLMFCKKTVMKFAEPMYQASKGGRLIKIKTKYKEYKKLKYYGIIIEPTTRALVGSPLSDVTANIDVPTELFEKYMNIFRNPSKGVKSDTDTSQERAR